MINAENSKLLLLALFYNIGGSNKLPVLVWIHGGAFTIGSGSLYGPDYFMDQPIVLVTINYRLGALGFLHLNDDDLPGNYGMKDQIAALQWVQRNINSFGGDSRKVTIAGQSAGGASVHWHMHSRLSQGLFHRAISASGTAMNAWAEVPRRIASDRGLILARLVGCNHESRPEIVKCLKRIPAYELIKAQDKFTMWSYHPMSFGIVPEKEDSSVWKLRTLDVNIPWLTGFTSNEQEDEVARTLDGNGDFLEYLRKNHEMLFPILFMYNVYSHIRTESEMRNVTEKLREFYFKNETIHRGTLTQLQNLWSDSLTLYDNTEAALRHGGVTYFYVFSHLQERSFAQYSVNKDYHPSGPVHCDDLISIFNCSEFPQPLNSADKHISELLINVWTNFITTGNPNNATLGFQWRPLSVSRIEYLNIDKNPEMKSWYWEDRFSFWRTLNLRNEPDFQLASSNLNDDVIHAEF